MLKSKKKRIFLLAALLLLIALGVTAFCLYNSAQSVAIRSVVELMEDFGERDEWKMFKNVFAQGSAAVDGKLEQNGETHAFGGKIYVDADETAVTLENVFYNELAFSAYIGSDYAYLSDESILKGTYGITEGNAEDEYRLSALRTFITDPTVDEAILSYLSAIDEDKSDAFQEDAEELVVQLAKRFYMCLLDYASFSSETKKVETGKETVKARLITVKISEKAFWQTCRDFLQIAETDKDLREFIEKYEKNVQNLLDGSESASVRLYEWIDQTLKDVKEKLEDADHNEGWCIELATPRLSAELWKLSVKDLFTGNELFTLDIGEQGIQDTDRIAVTYGKIMSAEYHVKQNDDEAFIAKLSMMDIDILRIEVDKNVGNWEASLLSNELLLKGYYERNGGMTTVALTKTAMRTNTDLSLRLTVTLNEKDSAPIRSQSEMQSIFALSAEELTAIRDRAQSTPAFYTFADALSKFLQSIS